MTAESVLQWWSFVFLGVAVYFLGQQIKKVPAIANTAWYHRTVVFHAPVAATLVACIPLFPMPDALGGDIGTRILYGLVAGIASSWSYKAFMRLLGRDTKSIAAETGDSLPPSES